MDTMRISAETAERRKREVEDVQKRNNYRKAHGLYNDGGQGLGLWNPPTGDETRGPSLKSDGPVSERPVKSVPDEPGQSSMATLGVNNKEQRYVDWEGKTRPVKKWLGIW